MRPVYVVAAESACLPRRRPDKNFQGLVKEAYDYAVQDLGVEVGRFTELADGSVASCLSDHFAASSWRERWRRIASGSVPSRASGSRAGHHRRALLPPGGVEGGGERLPGCLRRLRLRSLESSRNLERERFHRPRLRRELRLSGGGISTPATTP